MIKPKIDPKCRSCGAPVAPPTVAGAPAVCAGCGRRVCVDCGCTDERACSVECVDEPLTCSWVEWRPEICLFCLWRAAESAYLEATSEESLLFTFARGLVEDGEEVIML